MAYVKMIPYIWIPSAPTIYGAEWSGGADPSWTRTDDAVGLSDPNPAVNNRNGNSPFDTIYPWRDMKRMNDSASGTLVEIPKFYYKWIRSGTKMKLLITDRSSDGFFVSPAHADRGDGKGERDVVYVGAYHCANNTYKSTSGVKPQTNKSRAQFRTAIHNLGSTIWQNDYAMYWTIRMLYLVEYANWNVWETLGGGRYLSSSKVNMGYTDSMQYHTGTTASSISHIVLGGIRYRWIEGLYDNVYDWVDGINLSPQSSMYACLNPANFADANTNYEYIGSFPETGMVKEFIISNVNNYEFALIPNVLDNKMSYDIYTTANYNIGSQNVNSVLTGGYYNATNPEDYRHASFQGLFYLSMNNNITTTVRDFIGSRLMKLP